MIYICIPSHNEEHTIGVLLWKIRQVLTAFPRDYQLLVLDDGSDDRTPEVLAPYARILPLSVLHHPRRKGYAASLDELLREAVRRSEYPRRDVVVTLQADFTEEPDEIPSLLKRIESGADVVTTRLRIAPARAPRKIRWMRAIATRVLRRLDWPGNVTDMLSGFRAYRVVGLRKALEQRNGDRLLVWHDAWAANAALLKAVQPFVRRVDEVEVAYRPDRLQRPSRFDAWATARQLLRLAFGRESGTPVPARHGGPAFVPTAELAAAAEANRAQGEAPRRGRRGKGEAPTPTGARRPARPDADARAPGRGRREHPEREEVPARTGRAGRAKAERGEPEDRSARGERERQRRSRGKEAAPAGEAAEDIALPADGQQAASAKSKRRRRGGGEAAGVPEETGGATPQAAAPAAVDGRPAQEPAAAGAGAGSPVEGAADAPESGGSAFPFEEPGAAGAEARVDAAPPPPALAMQALAPGDEGRGGAGEALQLDLEIPLEGVPGGEGRRRRRSRRGRGRRGRGAAQEGLPEGAGEPDIEDAAPAREGMDAAPAAATPHATGGGAGNGAWEVAAATQPAATAPPPPAFDAVPADAPETAPLPSELRVDGEEPQDAGGTAGSPDPDAEGDAAVTGRHRRSRRGGRGRSRARRATPDAVAGPSAPEGAADAPETSSRPAPPPAFDVAPAEAPETSPRPAPPPAFDAAPAEAPETSPRPTSPDRTGGAGEQDRPSEMEREQE